MGKNSKIEWCDHTFNPWIGCTKVSPGCENCYAERDNKRFKWNPEGWGPGKARKRTSKVNWLNPLNWNRKAEREGTRPRVFCGSLCDIFDFEVLGVWLWDLMGLIRSTPNLEWLLLTKRIGNVWPPDNWFSNARLGITVCNQEEADRDIPKLLKLGVPNFLSIEPMLGPIDLKFYLAGNLSNRGLSTKEIAELWGTHVTVTTYTIVLDHRYARAPCRTVATSISMSGAFTLPNMKPQQR